MKPAEPRVVREVRLTLSNEANSCSPALFPARPESAFNPGLYSWWADPTARKLIGKVLASDMTSLIYVGQAGATRWPSATKSKATLASRIKTNHINGNVSSSTFRLTVSAILMEPLALKPGKPGRLIPVDQKRVSDWIKEHLRIVIAPYTDRDSLEDLESQVLQILDPPLNLRGMPSTPVRSHLSALRKRITSR